MGRPESHHTWLDGRLLYRMLRCTAAATGCEGLIGLLNAGQRRYWRWYFHPIEGLAWQPDDHWREMFMNENQLASLLGHAALKVWPELPREAQERLFAAAVDDAVIASSLAELLHDRHPKTAHPPKPTRLA